MNRLRTGLIASPAWLNGMAAALWLLVPWTLGGHASWDWMFRTRDMGEFLGVPLFLLSVVLGVVVHRIESRWLGWACAMSWLLVTLMYLLPGHVWPRRTNELSLVALVAALWATILGFAGLLLLIVALRSCQGQDGWRVALALRLPFCTSLFALGGALLYQSYAGAYGLLFTGSGGLAAYYEALEVHRLVGFVAAAVLALALLARNLSRYSRGVAQQGKEPAKARAGGSR